MSKKKIEKVMKPSEYVKNKGLKCPKCGGNQIEGDSIEIDGGEATQRVRCSECDSEWTDTYTLTGYINLE